MEVRPTLADPALTDLARATASALAERLGAALEAHDADLYDADFAADILWGSPHGATLAGFDRLNTIHHALMTQRSAPASRFEVLTAHALTTELVLTHIRRQALDPEGFSETALYVLIRREDRWWLAAAQNTPIVA